MNPLQRRIPYDQRLHLEEVFTIGILTLLNLLMLIRGEMAQVRIYFFLNAALIIFLLGLAYAHPRIRLRGLSLIRDWCVLPIIVLVYFQHNILVPMVNPHDMDPLLIRMDRWLFAGQDPTVLLEAVTTPWLTEGLQIVYASFYFLPITLCLLLYVRGDKPAFHTCAATIMLGFYVSYVGYYLSPAIGPRFTLNHLQSFPLTGLFAYDAVAGLINRASGVTRDCCPSGHTLISLLTALLALKYHRPFARIAAPWAALLIVSTLYLRYHYVMDIIAGVLIAWGIYRFARPWILRQTVEAWETASAKLAGREGAPLSYRRNGPQGEP